LKTRFTKSGKKGNQMDNNCFDCQAEGQICDMCVFVTEELDDYKAMLEEVERERQ